MISIPVGFDYELLISDLCVVGIPFITVAVAFCVFRIIQKALDGA